MVPFEAGKGASKFRRRNCQSALNHFVLSTSQKETDFRVGSQLNIENVLTFPQSPRCEVANCRVDSKWVPVLLQSNEFTAILRMNTVNRLK